MIMNSLGWQNGPVWKVSEILFKQARKRGIPPSRGEVVEGGRELENTRTIPTNLVWWK